MTAYTAVFGGSTVYQSPLSYALYNPGSGTTLALTWALDNFPNNQSVCAKVMEINPQGPGVAVQLPPANAAGPGETTLVVNTGAVAFTVTDNIGGVLASIAPGALFQFYLRSNTTPQGAWGAFQYGAQVSTPTVGGLAGSGLIAVGATLSQSIPSTSLSTNYVLSATDRAKLLVNVGGAFTWTLPPASTVGNGWYAQIRNAGTASLILQAGNNTDPVNGVSGAPANVTLLQKDSCFVVSDGASWWTIGLTNLAGSGFSFLAISLAGLSGNVVLAGAQLGITALRFTGTPANNCTIIVPATVNQYWLDNETTGGFTITAGTLGQVSPITLVAGSKYITFCDGVNLNNASTAVVSGIVPITQGGTGGSTAGQALTNLGGTSVGTAVFTAANVAAAQGALQVDQILFGMLLS